MCYLFAISSKKEKNFKKYIQNFYNLNSKRSAGFHGHGYFLEKEDFLYKNNFNNFNHFDFNKNITNAIFHIREADFGEIRKENNHPFLSEINGNKIIFAHNGNLKTIKNYNLNLEKKKPEGTTDSELSFCHFLNNYKNDNCIFLELFEHCKRMSEMGNYNILVYFNEYIFAFCTSSLHLLENNEYVIISTVKLTNNQKWNRINKKSAILLKNGAIIKHI